jgi:RNA-splicing ligase RtcB
MITMQGKYNSANIMIDEIDETTKAQIQSFLNHPAFADSYIAIMPDCHAGKGAVIGFTMKVNDYIIPNVVGVDIGCGMLSARFDVNSLDLEKFDRFVKQNIPSGFHLHSNQTSIKTQELGSYHLRHIVEWCNKIGMDNDKAIKSIGSLGGGNHFLECGLDSNGKIRVTIHSGSRNFGLRIANHFQELAKKNLKKYFLQNTYKDTEFLLTNEPDGQTYLKAVRYGAEYAELNRRTMLNIISRFFNSEPQDVIESVHNFIGQDNIIRKGATPANKDQMVIIPFNMKDGIAICRGKGSQKYNFSAPHGAGRILSRTKAKAQLNVESFKKEMSDAGVYTTTATKDTLDEAPGAYKDKDIILQNIAETVDVIEMIKPIYNFKAGGD